ncbi:adrenodoxin-like protein 2, mitochondrial isoform X1 [Oryza glaberrima]|nr:adrenodoxin-like protein 2, mitochondrial isoform X1 [Oryza glaberrima]
MGLKAHKITAHELLPDSTAQPLPRRRHPTSPSPLPPPSWKGGERRRRPPATGRVREWWCWVVKSAAAMLSRISQLGARLLRENRAAGSLASSTTSYYRGQLSRRFVPTKNILFSTATTSSDRDDSSQSKEKISVTFVNKDGTEQTISVPVGMSMLEAAHENDIELEGACEGSLACSTCHVIVMDVNYYNKLEDPTDEENDMLDLAFGLTETSRLGCQVIAKPELDGMRLALPAATRNFAVDGFVPKPH